MPWMENHQLFQTDNHPEFSKFIKKIKIIIFFYVVTARDECSEFQPNYAIIFSYVTTFNSCPAQKNMGMNQGSLWVFKKKKKQISITGQTSYNLHREAFYFFIIGFRIFFFSFYHLS